MCKGQVAAKKMANQEWVWGVEEEVHVEKGGQEGSSASKEP